MKIQEEWDSWDPASLYGLITLYDGMQWKLTACQSCGLCERNMTFGVALTADTKN